MVAGVPVGAVHAKGEGGGALEETAPVRVAHSLPRALGLEILSLSRREGTNKRLRSGRVIRPSGLCHSPCISFPFAACHQRAAGGGRRRKPRQLWVLLPHLWGPV